MKRPANMNTIQYFEAVARHSRVNIAAEELSVSPSAVSQQIKSLEEQLGVLLFRRVKRRLILTEEGERLYASATEALKLLRDAQMRVSHTREYRRLVIRVAASFGVRWLGRRIADFVTKNPGVELHVDATSSLTDFEKENVDLEMRYGVAPPQGLYTQALIEDRVLPMCSPKLAATAGGSDLSTFLETTTLIHTVKAAVTWRQWTEMNDFLVQDDGYALRFDRSSMSLQAAVDGVGVVLETATLAMDELRSGDLVPLAPDLGTLNFPAYWMICPARYLNRRAVKTFHEWIEGQAESHEQEKDRLLRSLGCDRSHPYPAS